MGLKLTIHLIYKQEWVEDSLVPACSGLPGFRMALVPPSHLLLGSLSFCLSYSPSNPTCETDSVSARLMGSACWASPGSATSTGQFHLLQRDFSPAPLAS